MDRVTTLAADDFDGFYHAYFGDTVVATYGHTADLAEAQDITQEAFLRAWLRWRSVSAYDDPAAWVRRIACNLAMSRWRRLKVAAAYLGRQRPGTVAPVDEDHVAVVAALRKLPERQREAVVLHYMMDVPLAEVAQQVGAPVGTVKSWLHRSRSMLARELAEQIRQNVTVPPTDSLQRRAAQHKTRAVVTAAVVVALVVLGAVAWQVLGPNRSMPTVVPTPTPTPTPSAPTGLIRKVDWVNATIDVDAAKPACPSGVVSLSQSSASPTALLVAPDYIAYGDLDGDGEEDAVLRAECAAPTAGTPHDLVAIQRRPDGTLHTLGWIPPFGLTVMERWIADGVLYAEPRPGAEPEMFGRVRGWRWDGHDFVNVDAYRRYPQLLPKPSGRTIDFSDATGSLKPCAGRPAPAALTFGPDRLAKNGPQIWELGPGSTSPFGAAAPGGPRFLQLGRYGRPYLVTTVSCRSAGVPDEHSLVILDLVDGGWQAVAAIAIAEHGIPVVFYQNSNQSNMRLASVDDRLIRVSIVDLAVGGGSNNLEFRFDGASLTRLK
ncbi:hypothetical protein Rhe02_02670 [Rhizocola hellebori]|uniref:Sigma-70 family RNA polymerase sigma factor n=1 Tax=Rhizocola hellebori TaxID=1392758 RepID=A0A8J3VCY3_9ACTN|nr:SigE family RNA polymerase sigma factor [Rhizocola hellebori]GIH02200.1 hypothetical protein Rhe02_02670 [Rhizocola hellebori]